MFAFHRSIEPVYTLYTALEFKGEEICFDTWCSEDVLEKFIDESYIYEQEVISAILNFVRPGDFCIDAGANLGYHSLLMAKLVGDTGEVLSIEPDSGCIDKFKANVALNNAKNINLLPVALWSDKTDRPFYSAEHTGYSSFLEYADIKCDALAVRIDKLDNIIDVPVRLLKIDCEGAEEHILHGAEKLLAHVDCVIVEFNFRIMEAFNTNEKDLRDYMHKLGFDFFYLCLDGAPPKLIPSNAKLEMNGKNLFHFNGMFVKRGVTVEWTPWRILD